MSFQIGDHVCFYRLHAQQRSYGTVRALHDRAGVTFVEIYSEDRSHTIWLPERNVALYARRGATK